jgi:hypothetical protein
VAATIVLHVEFTSKASGKPSVQRSNTPLVGRLVPLAAAFHDTVRAQRSPKPA